MSSGAYAAGNQQDVRNFEVDESSPQGDLKSARNLMSEPGDEMEFEKSSSSKHKDIMADIVTKGKEKG